MSLSIIKKQMWGGKILALTLAFTLMLGMTSLRAYAADTHFPAGNGDGTQASPFQITTEAELAKLAELVNTGNTTYTSACYKLMNNLDLSTSYGSGYNDGKGWIPIGHENNGSLYFRGSFDGNGKTISGLYINNTAYGNTGLFGRVEGSKAAVKNLGIVDAAITGTNYVGGVAGYVSAGAKVEDCYATGAVIGTKYVGGVAGGVYSGTVQNCYATGDVSGGGDDVGGVAGRVEGGTAAVKDCHAAVAVRGTGYYVGGVAGNVYNGATVQDCHATGAVIGTRYVGGVAGRVDVGNAAVRNCYATGAVSGYKYVGGVAGQVVSGATVQNCYATGDVTGTNTHVGGVAGTVSYMNPANSMVQNCYATGAVSGTQYVGGVAGYVETGKSTVKDCAALNPSVSASSADAGRVVGYSRSEGKHTGNIAFGGMTVTINGAAQTPVNNANEKDGETKDFAAISADGTLGNRFPAGGNPWTTENGKLPGLGAAVDMPVHLCDANFPAGNGTGTQVSPFQITTAVELAKLAQLVNAGTSPYANAGVYYTLMNNLDLSDYDADNTAFNSGRGWIPIGHNAAKQFKGSFDGNGKTISGLYINNPNTSTAYGNTGLFGRVEGSTAAVKNLGIVGATITGRDYTGGVAGAVYNGATVENCYATGGAVCGNYDVGGVAGRVEGGRAAVKNCYATGAVIGNDDVGGVVGEVYKGTVKNCYATGDVTGNGTYVGGVAGSVDTGATVENCYATGAVSGNDDVGGVAGHVGGGMVKDCAALNPSVTATNSGAAAGRVVGNSSGGTLSGNIAFGGMTVTIDDVDKSPLDATLTGVDGETKGFAAISADGTLGGRFPSGGGNPWTTENDKLPGFGVAVDMPNHIYDANFPAGNGGGTQGNPFQITTAAELAKLAHLVNTGESPYADVYYILMNDLALSDYDAGKGWVPIGHGGTGALYFKGSFDGNGKIISGLYINNPASDGTAYDNTGLFGRVEGSTAVVKNLGIVGADITGYNYTGGVAGDVMNSGTVQNCYVTGAVSGNNYVGGVAGDVVSNATVQNCYATGAVSGNDYIGGVAGRVDGGTVKDCAALNPSVTATNSGAYAGRVVGYRTGGTFSNNIAFGRMTVTINGAAKSSLDATSTGVDGETKGIAAIRADGTLGGRFPAGGNPWTTENGKLPGFGVAVEMPDHLKPPFSAGNGDGTQGNPYQITTAAELFKLAQSVNADESPYADADVYYILMNDLDLSDYGSGYNAGKGWIPIGHEDNGTLYFRGSFDGNGKTISGLYINNPASDGTAYDNTGLFGAVSGSTAVVKNLGIVGADITGYNYTGGVAGSVYDGTVQNCYVTGAVSGNNYTGGVAGYVSSGTVENCYATGAVSGSFGIGGVAGYVFGSGTVQDCAALNPSVTATNSGTDAGRVVGTLYLYSGTLSGNIAFGGMTVTIDGADKSPLDATATGVDGLAKSKAELHAASGFPAALTASPWVYEAGKLPGLGAAVAMPLHLQGDFIAPTLTAGSVNRTSDTQATIDFTADEAGTAYYLVVNSGATAPAKTDVKVANNSLGSVSASANSGLSVTLTAGAKDIYVVVEDVAGNISDPLKIAAPDVTAPTVASVTPSGTGVATSGNVVITFDEAMDTGTTGTVQLNSLSALTGGAWSAGNTVFTIAYSSLAHSTAYTVNISGFEDAAGNTMTADNTHSFTTVAPTLITAAALTGVTSPVGGATPSTTIDNGTGFTASLAWNGSPATFAYSTAYTATVTLTAAGGYTFSGGFAITADIAGFTVNGIAPVWVSNSGTTLVFTVTFPATGAAPDIIPPTVAGVMPSGTGVATSGNVVITFDEAMDTGTTGTVQLNSLSALTDGAWSAGNTVFTIAYSGLTNSTAYTVNISGFKDAAGNAMTADNTHCFTTVAPAPTYGVSIATFTGGSVSANKAAYQAGETVTLSIAPATGYELNAISAYRTGTPATTVALSGSGNSRTFSMPAYGVTVTATFQKTQATLDAESVAAAKAAIESISGWTVAQATANSAAAVKTWIAQRINALAGFSATGVTVTATNITLGSFNAAVAGTASAPAGTNGSFRFTVSLSKGSSSTATVCRNGTITATGYVAPPDYAVTVSATTNGTVTASPVSAPAGATVTLTISPAAGYEPDVISAYRTGAPATAVALSGSGNTRTFTMPAYGVTVTATFRKTQATLNAEAVAAVKAAVEGGTYRIAQATGNDAASVRAWLINTLKVMFGQSHDVQFRSTAEPFVGDVTVASLTPAVAGTETTPDGTNGSFTFTVTLTRGQATAVTVETSGVIVATPHASVPVKRIELLHSPGNLTVRIVSTGNMPTGALTLALSGANADVFTLPTATLGGLAVGGETDITLTPRADLPAGTYTATLTVGGEGLTSVSVELSHTVAPTSVESLPSAPQLKAWTHGSTLYVSGLTAGRTWSVYAVSGALVYCDTSPSGGEANITLPTRGVYIIQSGNTAIKVAY
jgi:hypothetical protein